MTVLPLMLILVAALVAVIALAVVSFRPSTPIGSTAGRGLVLALAGLGAALVVVATQSDFWLVTEAESEVTGRYMVSAASGVNSAATLMALVAAVMVTIAAVGRRSFGGVTVAASWLLLGAMWFSYAVDNTSSRSSAELGPGPAVLTWAVVVLTMATAARWVTARVENHATRDRLQTRVP